MLGTIVDSRYELLRLVGSGGMGTVYEALHLGTGQRVAVKLIARAELVDDEEILVRFQREAKVAARIDTPHIVNIIDAGRDRASGLPFIAMELLDGSDVKQLVARFGALTPDLALRIAAQACSGLKKAHEAGIVHRDIKPANIFLARRPDGSVLVKLLDFGIAKLPPALLSMVEGGQLTVPGKLLGSPLFMSPEQAKGLKTLDHRTDIWSLGAVLYQALAGHAPFSSCTTVGQLIVAICSQPPEDLELVAPWAPPASARIVRRAMSIDVDQRYATATDMLAELAELLPGGAAIDESLIVGMSDRSAPAVAPEAFAGGVNTPRTLVASPSPKHEDRKQATVISPAPPERERGSSMGSVKVSQPARPVTVSLVSDPRLEGPTLASGKRPEVSDPGTREARSVGARDRARARWVRSSAIALGVAALVGGGARWLSRTDWGRRPSAAISGGGASTTESASGSAPPSTASSISRDLPVLAEPPSTGAIPTHGMDTPDPPPSRHLAPTRSAPSLATSVPATAVPATAAPATSIKALAPIAAAGPPASSSALASSAGPASSLPSTGTIASPNVAAAPAPAASVPSRSKFNTLNPNFE